MWVLGDTERKNNEICSPPFHFATSSNAASGPDSKHLAASEKKLTFGFVSCSFCFKVCQGTDLTMLQRCEEEYLTRACLMCDLKYWCTHIWHANKGRRFWRKGCFLKAPKSPWCLSCPLVLLCLGRIGCWIFPLLPSCRHSLLLYYYTTDNNASVFHTCFSFSHLCTENETTCNTKNNIKFHT